MNPIDVIEQEVKYYEDTTLDVNPSFAPNMEELYQLIDCYWVSRFREGDSDSLGAKRVFYNIVNFPTEVAAKMIDLDTKDILLIAENWASYWPSWLMQKELKMWMKDKYFGRQLNDYALIWPKYGHLFVKKVKDDVICVPPQNMIYRPNAVDLDNVPLIEKHKFATGEEMAETARKSGWSNYEEQAKTDGEVIVYEAWFPKGYLKESKNYFIICDGKELSSSTIDKPYKHLAYEKVPGRATGRGTVEKLFEEQIYLNRIANYKAEGLHWTSKHLYQTRDGNISGNLLTEVDNGEVLRVNQNIEPIVNEERNLSAYASDEAKWLDNANKRTFAREPISGGRAPSGTPLGSTILQQKMATGFFEQKKEELAMFVKEILWDWVIPQFKNQNRSEHKVLIENLITGSEQSSEAFFSAVVDTNLKKKQISLLKQGKIMDTRQAQMLKSIIAQRVKNEEFKIPKNLYENLKYKIDIVIVGEQIDVATRQATMQSVLQLLASNPDIMKDKTTRGILNSMLDMAGINPKDIGVNTIPDMTEQAGQGRIGQGGSIAKPQMPQQMHQTKTPMAL